MKEFFFALVCLLINAVCIVSQAHAQGTVQFSTYYPAPYGVYDRLRLVPRSSLTTPCDEGTFYYDSNAGGLRVCDGSSWIPFGQDVWTQDIVNDYIYPTDTASNPNLKIGIGTITPSFKLSLSNDGGILAEGTYASGVIAPSGAGTRLMWYPRKAALRAGQVTGSQWDDGNIGGYSVGLGYDAQAVGAGAISIGYRTIAGIYSSAIGKNVTTATDQMYSTAIGHEVSVTNSNAMALGMYLSSTADGAFVFGKGVAGNKLTNTTANSLAIGLNSNIPTLFVGPSAGIGTTGNVGIGTTTPAAKLHVKSNATPLLTLEEVSTTFTGDWMTLNYTLDGITPCKWILSNLYQDNKANLLLRHSPGRPSEQLITITDRGEVGIGSILNPSVDVEIYSGNDRGAIADLRLLGTGVAGYMNAYSNIQLGADTNSNGRFNTAWAMKMAGFSDSYSGGIKFIYNDGVLGWEPGFPNSGKREALILRTDMQVYIPNNNLTVGTFGSTKANVNVNGSVEANGYNDILYNLAYKFSGNIAGLAYENVGISIKNGNTTNMLIKDAGLVGIKTTSPASTLSIGIPNDTTYHYLQIDSFSGITDPPSADCDNVSEIGRMLLRTGSNERLFVCSQDGGGTVGWESSNLN